MSVLKPSGAKPRLSLARIENRGLYRRTVRHDHAEPSEIKPNQPWTTNKPRMNSSIFLEDFIGEHSLQGLPITSIEMPGSF